MTSPGAVDASETRDQPRQRAPDVSKRFAVARCQPFSIAFFPAQQVAAAMRQHAKQARAGGGEKAAPTNNSSREATSSVRNGQRLRGEALLIGSWLKRGDTLAATASAQTEPRRACRGSGRSLFSSFCEAQQARPRGETRGARRRRKLPAERRVFSSGRQRYDVVTRGRTPVNAGKSSNSRFAEPAKNKQAREITRAKRKRFREARAHVASPPAQKFAKKDNFA